MIEFYVSCKLKEGGDKHPPIIANTIRQCLFDNQIITSGRQFYIYINAERHNLDDYKNAVLLNFLCKIDRTPDLTLDELNVLLEPAFKILSEKNKLDNFKIRKI
jgi:hypothetical protein